MKRPKISRKQYVVETVENDVAGGRFAYVGIVTVDSKWVHDAIKATGNIKDNMPSKFAKREALKKYPKLLRGKAVLVMPIDDWTEKYGSPKNYKQGDTVK